MELKFFERMKTFAKVLLVLGIIGVVIMCIKLIFIDTEAGSWCGTYSNYVFNPLGLGVTVGTALSITALYFLLNGIALIGEKMFNQSAISFKEKPVPLQNADKIATMSSEEAPSPKSNPANSGSSPWWTPPSNPKT